MNLKNYVLATLTQKVSYVEEQLHIIRMDLKEQDQNTLRKENVIQILWDLQLELLFVLVNLHSVTTIEPGNSIPTKSKPGSKPTLGLLRENVSPNPQTNVETSREKEPRKKSSPTISNTMGEGRAYYNGTQVLEAICDVPSLSRGFCIGNAVKYLLRAGKKNNNDREDIVKAKTYIDWFLSHYDEYQKGQK